MNQKEFFVAKLTYSVASVVLGLIIFWTFIILHLKVPIFELDRWNNILMLSTSILIPYLFLGIWHILDELDESLSKIKFDPEDCINTESMQSMFRGRLSRPWPYIGLVFLVLLTFFAIDFWHFRNGDNIFYYWELNSTNSWNFLLDIYLIITKYSINFLLANLLWLVMNMNWIFSQFGGSYRNKIKINLFDADGFGGLGRLKNLILKTGLFYFSCISLAIISYSSPFNDLVLICYENILYLLMMIIGASFFFISFGSLKIIMSEKVDEHINLLSKCYQMQQARFIELASMERGIGDNDEISRVSSMLETLHMERERIIKAKGNDYAFIAALTTSLIISTASKVLVVLLQIMLNKQDA